MSISTQISRLAAAKEDIADAITTKGVDVPAGTKLDGLAALIAQIPVMTESEAFLAAHPVGSIFKSTKSQSPALYGGTWKQVPSLGSCTWERTA